MTDSQNAKLSMYQVVLNTCRDNESIYAGVPAFAKAVDELSNYLAATRQALQQQSGVVVKGSTKEKGNAEDRLVQSCIKVANALYVYAFTEKNQGLLPKVMLNKSVLYKAQNNEALTLAKNIAAEAAAYAQALTEYGIGDAERADLDRAIADFGSLIVKPRSTTSERKQHTESLAKLFSEADSVLYDKLDKLIGLFKTSAPAFVSTYKSARSIINTGARKKKPAEKKE